ncbi:hymenoptaecin [Cephus cinctus]|uniref:Hymenoptaecin n=1 Tax=Cephus cinctus TaxID=211228 RepID=A0AAJ7BXF9_CEPCN|nr:hymenoptaecin [Cephus cinctus]
MKLIIAAAFLCAVAADTATLPNEKWPSRSTGPTFPRPNNPQYRFRREDDLNRRIRVQGNIPVGNSHKQPSVDVNYEHRLSDTGRRTVDAYSGLNIQSGRVQPHAGVRFEHNFDNGLFLKGYGQGQAGRGGRVEPQFGAGFGLRFRRDVEAEETDAEFEEQ